MRCPSAATGVYALECAKEALSQLVGAPECALPWLFVLACVGDLIAVPAEEKTVREEQLGEAPATTSNGTPRTEEIGAEATEMPRSAIETFALREATEAHPLMKGEIQYFPQA
jgi:hypothetical protein